MKTPLTLALLLGLWSLPAWAGESADQDSEAPLVKDGVLGTVNVLRELDVKTWTNRVTVTSNVAGDHNSKPEDTIDGSGKMFSPEASKPVTILTYTLPGLRTVSSLAVTYWRSQCPETLRLEGSGDGGKTWFELIKSKPRRMDVFLKCFKPAKVNALRLTQEDWWAGRTTKEVFVYADPDVALPLFGGKDSGAFSFLRELWYRGKIKPFRSPKNAVWTSPGGDGKSFPHVPFMSAVVEGHDGSWGRGPIYEKDLLGKRLYLRLDLDKAYPMKFGLIGCPVFERPENNLAGQCRAEFYTANGNLDPAKLAGSSTKDITGQGWVLQKTWDRDGNPRKSFLLEHPGTYNQILLTWECQGYEIKNEWSHLEMFGSDAPANGRGAQKE